MPLWKFCAFCGVGDAMAIVKLGDKLGDILVKAGLLTREQLEKTLALQRGTSKRIGELLVELGLVTELDITVALSKQLGLSYVTFASGLLTPQQGEGLETLVPAEFARQHLVLPLSRNLNTLTVACVNPYDLILMDNLARLTACEINPVVTSKTDMEKAIHEFYDQSAFQEAIGKSYQLPDQGTVVEEEVTSLDRLKQEAEEAPVIRLVDLIIRQAILDRASDVHIEPFQDKLVLRYRIDGVLYEIPPPAKHLHPALISRIKILSKLDIAEKRLPQDGGFMMSMEGQRIDFRISTIPTLYGEKVVVRILKTTPELLDLGQLGFDQRELEIFRKAIRSPYGMVLLSGPTGSGKTTTLYGALNEIKSPHKNILTIEDPVEYRLDGINQVQVKPLIGLTFARGLRAFLRQDPDTIMVGEVRDLETAEICVQAALIGRLVFSTVHTNDAPSVVTRLVNLGVAPFLLSSTLSLIVAQRLVRRLCGQCREAYEPLPAIREQFQITEDLLYRAKGCEHCGQTGYRGRVGIYEVMAMSDALRDLTVKGAPSHVLREAAVKEGLMTLWQSGLRKVRAGLTSMEELANIVVLEHE